MTLQLQFVPGFLHFVAFPWPGRGRLPKVAPSNAANTGSQQMITAFFAFTIAAFFCAVVVNVAATLATAGQAV